MKDVSHFAAMVIAVTLLSWCGSFAETPTPKWEFVYHSVVDLGEETVLLEPGNHPFYFVVTAESIGFEGWRQVYSGNDFALVTADGRPVERYPRFVDFRVVVSERPPSVPKNQARPQPLLVNCEAQCMGEGDASQFVTRLRFRVKIFRALHVTALEPKIIRTLGIAGSGERVYRLGFDLGEVPLADRIVLEVLSPAGERLSRFHLDM